MILPVGVGSGAVVLSNGRVVGGISVKTVTLPEGRESVTLVVAVTTKVETDSAVRGGAVGNTPVEFAEPGGIAEEGVISGTGTVEFSTGV